MAGLRCALSYCYEPPRASSRIRTETGAPGRALNRILARTLCTAPMDVLRGDKQHAMDANSAEQCG